jgi:hypothetical protein
MEFQGQGPCVAGFLSPGFRAARPCGSRPEGPKKRGNVWSRHALQRTCWLRGCQRLQNVHGGISQGSL